MIEFVIPFGSSRLDDEMRGLFLLAEEERSLYEDVEFVKEGDIVPQWSRFQVDVSRPVDRCLYLSPEDFYGVKVWKEYPPDKMELFTRYYVDFYRELMSGNADIYVIVKRLRSGELPAVVGTSAMPFSSMARNFPVLREFLTWVQEELGGSVNAGFTGDFLGFYLSRARKESGVVEVLVKDSEILSRIRDFFHENCG